MTRTEKRRRDREIVRDMLRVYAAPGNRPSHWGRLRPALEAAARRHGLAVPWAWREPPLRLVIGNKTRKSRTTPRTCSLLPLGRLLDETRRRRRKQGVLFDD